MTLFLFLPEREFFPQISVHQMEIHEPLVEMYIS